ncbi:MAG: hypothetical protein P1V20_02840 [Verrucomicrobiales bacterium]|nr:hypothetical protein [Verrucomicrobiales bacterium]
MPRNSKVPSFSRTSFQTGVFRLIPIPFVDDFLINRTRRRLVEKALRKADLRFEGDVPKIIASWEQRSFGQRIGSIMKGLILKPLKKLFRTVFFWFTVRDAGRTAAESYLLGRMVTRHLHEYDKITNEEARRLSAAFSRTVDRCDRKLASHAWSKIWSGIRRNRKVKRTIEEEAPGFLAQFDGSFRNAVKSA